MNRKNNNTRYAWWVEQLDVNLMENIIKQDGFPIPNDISKLPDSRPNGLATHEFLCTPDWKIYAVRNLKTGFLIIR